MVTQQILKERLRYDEITGKFYWLYFDGTRGGVRQGDEAGRVCNGYVRIGIDKKVYAAHRLAWMYVFGEFPSKCIDHIDGDRANNALANLRECDVSENNQNIKSSSRKNMTGFMGVKKSSTAGKFEAYIGINRRSFYLGIFDTPEKAHGAYLHAKRDLHPFSTI